MTEIPGHVFRRRLDAPLPRAALAEGVWIEDTDGVRYLDASGGAVVVNLGHGRRELARALYRQTRRCDYVHPTMFTTDPVEGLAEALSGHTPPGIDRFYFHSSGSEAVEAAVKLARQLHIEYGRRERIRLISRWKSYHGLTLGALAATGKPSVRTPFEPLLQEVVHIPPPYCLRCPYGLTHPGCGIRCALILEETILSLGPETVSAFLAETVCGATLAAVVPPAGYLRTIREICDRHGVLLILDEVMCGLGRTGYWFACERDGVVPDILIIGKGLGGGVVPLSAMGVQGRHFDALRRGSGHFVHGGTFSHHSVAAAVGMEVVRIIEQEDLVGRVSRLGPVLGATLEASVGAHPNVAEVRGIGFLRGIEFVADRDTLEPFPRRHRFTERLWEELFRRGVVVYRSTALAGTDGDALVIGPPFVMEEGHMDLLAEALASALDVVVRERY